MMKKIEEKIYENDGEELLNKEKAAAYLGVQPVTLWVLRHLGLVHPQRKRGQIWFMASELEGLRTEVRNP